MKDIFRKIKKFLGIKRTYERLVECPLCDGWGFVDYKQRKLLSEVLKPKKEKG